MKNLLISFPGGCGGNHLANLISLNSKFTPRFSTTNYHQDLINRYKEMALKPVTDNADRKIFNNITAHFSDSMHLTGLKTEEDFQKKINLETINIFTGHEHLFYKAHLQGDFINRMPEKFWIALTHPKINSIVYNRCKIYKIPTFPGKYVFPLNVPDYNHEINFPKIDKQDILLILTENFVSKNGCNYIKMELAKISIDLPDLAYELHEIWYNKMIEILTSFNMLPTKYSNEYGDLN